MLQAEIRKKLNVQETESGSKDLTRMEDILTSNFWGIIKNCESDILADLLMCTVPKISDFSTYSVKFYFWKRLVDGTELDVMIESGDDIIIIEDKLLSAI